MLSIGPQQATVEEAPGVVLSMARYWRPSLLIVAAFAAVAFAASLVLPERYVATTQVGLTDPGGSSIFSTAQRLQAADLERYTSRQAQLIESALTFDRVREITGRDLSNDELFNRIGFSSQVATIVNVSARASSPEEAQELANAVVRGFGQATRERVLAEADANLSAIEPTREQVLDVIEDAEQELEDDRNDPVLSRQLQAAVQSLDALGQRANAINVRAADFNDGIDYVEPARRPKSPAEPQPVRNAAVAGLLGLILAGVLAWIRADRHRAADEGDDPEAVLGAPMLGSVAELEADDDLAALSDAGSKAAEAHQLVTASLQYLFRSGVLLVTSAGRRDGKTVTAASMAAVSARDGSRVVLVDADVRSRGLSRRLMGTSGDSAAGLTDLAEGSTPQSDIVHSVALGGGPALPFVPAGRGTGSLASVFRSSGMANAVARLRDTYDLVIVDCPALLGVADVASLAAQADGLVVVVSRGTPLKSLEAVAQRLELLPAPLVGYVFTRDDEEEQGSHYASSSQRPWRRGRRRQRVVPILNGHEPGGVAGDQATTTNGSLLPSPRRRPPRSSRRGTRV